MGNHTSILDPRHVFTSPEQVQSQFLETLYDHSRTHLETLRALFEAKASKDNIADASYWTEKTFISYLVERNPDVKDTTRDAGPLLYKMIIHYGSFPFPTTEGKRMTCGTFLRGIYLLSRMKNRILWRDPGHCRDEARWRQRKPVNDVRLLFQSMVESHETGRQRHRERSVDDDEDLVDVLLAVMKYLRQRRDPKGVYVRHDVLEAAAALPSSLSRRLEGSFLPESLQCLFELVVGLLNARLLGTETSSKSAAVDCIMKSFCPATNRESRIKWENFRDVILESFPNLPTILSAFVEHTFQITTYFWLEPTVLPGSPQIHGVISQSSILSMGHVPQLLLIIPADLTLYFKGVLLHGKSVAEHTNEIATYLQAPGRLLVGKCSRRAAGEVLCIYTGAPEELRGHIHDPVAFRDGCVVFSLSPIHKVYYARARLNGHDNVVPQVELGRTPLDVMDLLEVEIESSMLRNAIDSFEIWTM